MNDHFYAVIMAGGGGTRLWPVSRSESPKQIIQLFGERSLFQVAVDRLQGFIPMENIYVVTIAAQVERLRAQEPEIPVANFLVEPKPRGTASVAAMAAGTILKLDKDSVLAILTADHIIRNVDLFRQGLSAANELANKGFIVTMGIKPTFASTGYGYIENGEPVGEHFGLKSFRASRFIEKPNQQRANELFGQPGISWNSGMFICRSDALLGEIKRHMPVLYETTSVLTPMLGVDHYSEFFIEKWSNVQPQTIDYGIMERSTITVVLPLSDLGWNDVGSWDSFFDLSHPDENGNIIIQAKHVSIDTSGSLIVSTDPDKLIVTMGMHNVIVVQTADALLICPRGESQRVKELVNYLKDQNYTLYL